MEVNIEQSASQDTPLCCYSETKFQRGSIRFCWHARGGGGCLFLKIRFLKRALFNCRIHFLCSLWNHLPLHCPINISRNHNNQEFVVLLIYLVSFSNRPQRSVKSISSTLLRSFIKSCLNFSQICFGTWPTFSADILLAVLPKLFWVADL